MDNFIYEAHNSSMINIRFKRFSDLIDFISRLKQNHRDWYVWVIGLTDFYRLDHFLQLRAFDMLGGDVHV